VDYSKNWYKNPISKQNTKGVFSLEI